MAWSNIFCKVIRDTGPIIGEGLLMGWQTDIQLNEFSWKFDVDLLEQKKDVDLGDAATLAQEASPLADVDKELKSGNFVIKKRFDVASNELHQIVDTEEYVPSVVVTVLHTAHGRGMVVNLPGFVVELGTCLFKSVETELSRGEKGIDVMETYEIEFRSISILYMKTLPPIALQVTVPTLEFRYDKWDAGAT